MDNDFYNTLESYLLPAEESYGSDLKKAIKYSKYRLGLIETTKEIKKLYKNAKKDLKNADKWKTLLEKYKAAIILANKFKDEIDTLPEPVTSWDDVSELFSFIFELRFPSSGQDGVVYIDDKAINSKSSTKRYYQKAMNYFIIKCGREIRYIEKMLANL